MCNTEFRSSASSRAGRATWVLPAIMLLTASLAANTQAQVVEGNLFVKNTREPIVLGVVALLDTAMTPVARTITNEVGAFSLVAPQPGAYYVAAHSPGFIRGVDGILDLGEGGHVTIEFFIERDPDAAPLRMRPTSSVGRGETSRRYLESVGFYKRHDEAAAWFLTPEDIEKLVVPDITGLFQRAPGVRVLDQPSEPKTLLFRGGSINPLSNGFREEDPQGYCTPRVIVDSQDRPVRAVGIPGANIEQVVEIRSVLAVEVHNGPTSLPPEFTGTATGGSCATIMIWTIRG